MAQPFSLRMPLVDGSGNFEVLMATMLLNALHRMPDDAGGWQFFVIWPRGPLHLNPTMMSREGWPTKPSTESFAQWCDGIAWEWL